VRIPLSAAGGAAASPAGVILVGGPAVIPRGGPVSERARDPFFGRAGRGQQVTAIANDGEVTHRHADGTTASEPGELRDAGGVAGRRERRLGIETLLPSPRHVGHPAARPLERPAHSAWRPLHLHKTRERTSHAAICQLWTHQFGWELRLEVNGDLLRSQV
jgi:hypothetical protein